MIDNIVEHIKMAQTEAIKQGIKANAVLINDTLYRSQFGAVSMICGLKVVYANDLPDDVGFAVANMDNLPLTKDEELEMLRRENQELKDRLEQIQNLIQGTS